jgi:hypothetical protein
LLRRRLGRLFAEALRVAPPFVGDSEEHGALVGIVGLFGCAGAFVGVLLVELSE